MSKQRLKNLHATADLALARERDRIKRIGALGNDIVAVRTGDRPPGEIATAANGCIEGARALLDVLHRQILDGRRARKITGRSARSSKA